MHTQTFKKLSLTLMLTVLVTLCSGCSDALTGYWGLGKEISSLEAVKTEGVITIGIEDENLSASLAENGVAEDMFEHVIINYSAEQNNQDLLSKFDFEVLLQNDMITATLPCRMYIDEQHIYISTEDIMAIIRQFADEEYITAYQEFFGDAKWVDILSLSQEELAAYESMLTDDYMATILEEYDLLIDLFSDAYSGLESDILTRKGDTYTMKLDKESTAAFAEEFVTYTIDNIDDVLTAFRTYFEKSTIIDEKTREELLAAWDTDLDGIEEEFAKLTTEDITGITDGFEGVLMELPLDFDIQYDLQRVRKGLYKENGNINLTYDIDGAPGYEGNVVITEQATTKSITNVKIELPTEGIVTMDHLIAEARKDADAASIYANIYLDEDYMYYTKHYAVSFLDDSNFATAEHRIVNNHTYLPLRQISEALGEEVGWDSAKKQAYVVVDGTNIYVNSFADTAIGRTYIKVRDFEQLGFTVDYTKDEYSGAIVTLTK